MKNNNTEITHSSMSAIPNSKRTLPRLKLLIAPCKNFNLLALI